jgi:hypothetical protein
MAKKKQPHTDRQASVVVHSLRCGVKTREGTPCKLPAKQNGRCWIHGKKNAESAIEEFDQSPEIIPEYQIEPESTDEQRKSVEEVEGFVVEIEKDAEMDAGSAEAEPVIELDADAIEILEADIQPETEKPPDSEETDDIGLEDSQLELLDDTGPGSDYIEIEPVIEFDADSIGISTDWLQPELEEASEPEEVLDTETNELKLELEGEPDTDSKAVIELDADAIELLEADIQPETEKPPDSEEKDDIGLEDSQLELLDDTGPGPDYIEIEPVIEFDADPLEISTDGIQPELEEASKPEEILDTETNELKLELEAEPDTDSEAVIDAYDDAIDPSEAKLQVVAKGTPIPKDDLLEEIAEDWLISDQELEADTGTEEVLDEQEPEPETAGLKLEDGHVGKPAEGLAPAEEWDDFAQTVEIESPKVTSERIETEKSQKLYVGLVKKTVAVSEKLKQLRKKQFTVSVLTMILTGLVVCIVFGAYAFNRLEPKIQDEGNLRITPMDIQSKVVNNLESGDLFVITGRVTNEYNKPRSFISVTGKLFTKNNFLKTETVYCGNVLSEKELSNFSPSDIKMGLSDRQGENRTNVNVKPGQKLPFMIVFFNLPDNLEDLDRYSVSISRSSPH